MIENMLQDRLLVETVISVIKILVIFGGVLGAVPFMVLLERKLLARIQQRSGPNRVGPWGLLQTIVDGIKLFLKEDIRPNSVDPFLHTLAPLLTVGPAIFILAIIPIGPDIKFMFYGNEYIVPLGITDLPIGILFYLASSWPAGPPTVSIPCLAGSGRARR